VQLLESSTDRSALDFRQIYARRDGQDVAFIAVHDPFLLRQLHLMHRGLTGSLGHISGR
jgi:hypothetical protein